MSDQPPIGEVVTMHLVINSYGRDDSLKRPRVYVASYAVKPKTLQLVSERRWPIPARLSHEDVGHIAFSDLQDAVTASLRMAAGFIEGAETQLREAREAMALASNEGSELLSGRRKPLEGR